MLFWNDDYFMTISETFRSDHTCINGEYFIVIFHTEPLFLDLFIVVKIVDELGLLLVFLMDLIGVHHGQKDGQNRKVNCKPQHCEECFCLESKSTSSFIRKLILSRLDRTYEYPDSYGHKQILKFKDCSDTQWQLFFSNIFCKHHLLLGLDKKFKELP